MSVKINITPEADTVTAKITGEIDNHEARQVRDTIDDSVRRNCPRLLVLDFGGVEFMDSSSSWFVLGRYRLMQDMGGKLILRNIPPHIRKVVQAAGIRNLDIHEEKRKKHAMTIRKPENLMKVSFPSRSINESLSRSLAAAFVALADPTVEELCDIKTAVSEAVTNAIVHGYRNTLGMIYITAALYPGGRVIITIRDRGCGIADVKKARQPLYTTCTTGERSGLGFAVMEEVMDKVQVCSRLGEGTIITMERVLNPGSNPGDWKGDRSQ